MAEDTATQATNDNLIPADREAMAKAAATKKDGRLVFPMVDATPRSTKVVDALIYAGIGFVAFVGATTVSELIKKQLRKKVVPVPVPGPIA